MPGVCEIYGLRKFQEAKTLILKNDGRDFLTVNFFFSAVCKGVTLVLPPKDSILVLSR